MGENTSDPARLVQGGARAEFNPAAFSSPVVPAAHTLHSPTSWSPRAASSTAQAAPEAASAPLQFWPPLNVFVPSKTLFPASKDVPTNQRRSAEKPTPSPSPSSSPSSSPSPPQFQTQIRTQTEALNRLSLEFPALESKASQNPRPLSVDEANKAVLNAERRARVKLALVTQTPAWDTRGTLDGQRPRRVTHLAGQSEMSAMERAVYKKMQRNHM